MVLQNQIDQPIVSVWLNKASNQDASLSNGGEFIFGGVDPSLHTGDITYLPVTSSKEWQISVDKLYIGRKELSLSKAASSAIVDTGSSYILFPDYLATAFHRAIPNSQYDSKLGWLIPCRLANSRTVGDLTFVLKGEEFSVPISDIVILKSEYNEYCLSAIDSWQELPGHGSQSVSALVTSLVLMRSFLKTPQLIFSFILLLDFVGYFVGRSVHQKSIRSVRLWQQRRATTNRICTQGRECARRNWTQC